jgi:hypothetical protein
VTGADFGGVDIDLLADYIGGALDGTPEESVVAARIAGDPAWQAAYGALREGMSLVSAELGSLTPEPMPATLADRLDTMLTGIVPLDADPTRPDSAHAADTAAAATAAGTETALDAADTTTTPVAAGTAASSAETDTNTAGIRATDTEVTSAGEAHAGGAGTPPAHGIDDPEPIAPEPAKPPVPHLALVRGDGTGEDAGGDGARGVRETQPAPRRGRRLRWAAPIAVAAGVVAFIGFGLDYLAGTQRNSASTDSAAGAGQVARGEAPKFAQSGVGPTLASGINYSHSTLAIAPVQPLVSGTPAAPGGPGRKSTPEMASGAEPALQRLTTPSALDDCLSAIQQANAAGALSVESIDYARFDGAPAVIVRFSASNGRWAWASGADCGTPPGDAATLDKVPVG